MIDISVPTAPLPPFVTETLVALSLRTSKRVKGFNKESSRLGQVCLSVCLFVRFIQVLSHSVHELFLPFRLHVGSTTGFYECRPS